MVPLGTTSLQTHQDISGKENTITDLAAIRSGALLGTTSLQTHQDISGKENTITDLAAIRSGALLGTTSLQTHQDISGKVDDSQVKTNVPENALFTDTIYNDLNLLRGVLLSGGFVLLAKGALGNRQKYTGSIANEESISYFWDQVDKAWYDADDEITGNIIVQFKNTN